MHTTMKELHPKNMNVYGGHACFTRNAFENVLCGYVVIKPGEPYYYQSESDIEAMIKCHGGITFDSMLDDNRRVIGFDCCHIGDYRPGVDGHRWTPEEVIKECHYIINQLNGDE